MRAFHRVELEVKGLQEPNDDGRDKDHREGALQKVLGLFPEEKENVLRARHAVVREFHHEGHGFALEEGLSHRKAEENRRENPEEVERHHDRGARSGEEGGRKEAVDRKLRRTAHEGREQNRHLAVALGGEGAARHHARDRAAEADEHRNDASARKPDLAQKRIHHERDAGHVAAVFQKGEKEKERHDRGQETQHAADPVEDPVDHESVNRSVHGPGREEPVDDVGEPPDCDLEDFLQPRADHVEGEPKNERHDRDEGGNRRVFARQDAVDLKTAQVLLALMRANDRAAADAVDESKPHVGHGGGAVESALGLHLLEHVFDRALFVYVELELLENEPVAFGDLARRKANGNSGPLGVVLDDVHDAVQTPVHGAAVVFRAAEVLYGGRLLKLRDVQHVVDKLVDPFALGGHDRHHRETEKGFHLVDADRAAVGEHFVHHVEREHHRTVELHELHREVEIALDVRRVDDVDDRLRGFLQDEFARDDFFVCVGRERIDPGKVGDERVVVPDDAPVLAVDRDPGEVPDVLIGPRQTIEERRFSAVLIARENKREFRPFGKGVFMRLDVILPAFAEARVKDVGAVRRGVRGEGRRVVANVDHFDFRGLGRAQREFVGFDAHFDGIAHRGALHHRDRGVGDESHVEKVLAQSALTAHRADGGGLSDGKVVEGDRGRHGRVLFF